MSVSAESLEGVSSATCAEQSDSQLLNRSDESNKPEPRRKRQLQGGFECKFVEEPPEQFQTECAICLCVLKDPYLVDCCCHSFCQSCIKPVQEEGKPCPVCTMKFTTCIPEKRLQRTLNEMKVYCPHKDLGCQWMDRLIKLTSHLDVADTEKNKGCLFVLIECSFCQKNIQRQSLKEHKTTKCPQRPYSCDYCNDYESTYEDVTTNHWPVCPSRPVPCPNECGVYPEHKQLDEHLSQQCALAFIKCPFNYAGCACEFPRKDTEVHLSEKLAYHMSLQAISHKQQLQACQSEINQLKRQVETLTIEKKAVTNQLIEERKHTHDCIADIKARLQISIDKVEEENRLLRHQVDQYVQEVTELKDKINQECKNRASTIGREIKLAQEQRFKGHVDSVQRQIKKLQAESKQDIMKHVESEIAIVHSHIGLVPFSFTMPDFEQMKSSNSPWYSPSFYTNPCGYKMCLGVCANGWDDGRNSHVSVYLFMMQGEYDNFLKWPFQGKIVIQMLNQIGSGNHCTENLVIAQDDKLGRVTKGERSESGWGFPTFIQHRKLLPGYLKNNSVRFCIKEVKLTGE